MTTAKTAGRTGEQQPGGQHETDDVDEHGHTDQPCGDPGCAGLAARHCVRLLVIQLAKTAADRLITQQHAHCPEKPRDHPGVDIGRQNHEAHLRRKAPGAHRQHHAEGNQADADGQLGRHDCAGSGHFKATRP
ncbi:hypothetical protein D3C81_1678950 [compost metagenome]